MTLPETGAATVNLINGSGKPVSVAITAHPAPDRIQVSTLLDGVETYGVWGLSPAVTASVACSAVSPSGKNTDGTFAITAVQHVPEKEAIVDNGAHFERRPERHPEQRHPSGCSAPDGGGERG